MFLSRGDQQQNLHPNQSLHISSYLIFSVPESISSDDGKLWLYVAQFPASFEPSTFLSKQQICLDLLRREFREIIHNLEKYVSIDSECLECSFLVGMLIVFVYCAMWGKLLPAISRFSLTVLFTNWGQLFVICKL